MAGDDHECEDPPGDTESSPAIADSPLSLNAMLELLTHHHRREILRLLGDTRDHAMGLDDVVAHLVKKDSEWTGARSAHNEIEGQLDHIHLPKLAEAGVIEYDARSKEMRYWNPTASRHSLTTSSPSGDIPSGYTAGASHPAR